MKFAFIIPTYNRPESLTRCLKSLFSLNNKNWQAIIVNDGSDRDYSEVQLLLDDERILYIELVDNKGVNFARNQALEQLKKQDVDYVCFIDDDETIIPEALDIVTPIIREKAPEWLVLQCFLNNQQTTKMAFEGKMDYINDYLYGNNLKKDATHFIQKNLATAQRFSSFVRNGEEWTYFTALADKATMLTRKIPVKYNYHQDDGLFLGEMNKSNLVRPYLMKLYRPYRALLSRPKNIKAWTALLLQCIKLPLRVPQLGYKWLVRFR